MKRKKLIIVLIPIILIVVCLTVFLLLKDNKNLKETKEDNTTIKQEVKEKEELQETKNETQEKVDNKEENTTSTSSNDRSNETKSNTTVKESTTPPVSNKDNSNTKTGNVTEQTQVQENKQEETPKVNSYIGVPSQNDFNYSFHHGKIEYSTLESCLADTERINLKDTVDIINSWCMDVVDDNGTVLGEYLYIKCSSGNCNKYKG